MSDVDVLEAPARRFLCALLNRALRDARRGDRKALDWLQCPWALQAVDLLDLVDPDDWRRELAAALERRDQWPGARGS